MLIDVDNQPEEYKDYYPISQRYEFFILCKQTSKTQVAHKSRSYTLIGQLLYFLQERQYLST